MAELVCPDCDYLNEVSVAIGKNCDRRFEFECEACGIWLPGRIRFDGNDAHVEVDHEMLEEIRTPKETLFSKIFG